MRQNDLRISSLTPRNQGSLFVSCLSNETSKEEKNTFENSLLLLEAAVVLGFPRLWGVCAPGSWWAPVMDRRCVPQRTADPRARGEGKRVTAKNMLPVFTFALYSAVCRRIFFIIIEDRGQIACGLSGQNHKTVR